MNSITQFRTPISLQNWKWQSYNNNLSFFNSQNLSVSSQPFKSNPHQTPLFSKFAQQSRVLHALPLSKGTKEQKWIYEGLITESLPNGMFWVRLDNQDLILGYVSGKIRRNSVRILPGDRVKVEISRYDSTKGRIIYRDSNN